MRFYNQVICAALAASVSVPALARIDDSFAASGSGELFWSVIDADAERSYTRDLGVSLTDFLAGVATGQVWSVAKDATFDAFLAGTANRAGLVWNLSALDGTGINRYLSTIAQGDTPPVFSNLVTASFNDSADAYLGAVNALPSHLADANGSSIATAADGAAYAGAATWGGNFGTKAAGFNNLIGVADSAELVMFEQSSSAFANRFQPGVSNLLAFGSAPYLVAFDGDALNISPVPEPETYALMGLGLLAVAAAARRRNRK